jgi:hypothetical protein
MDPKELIAALGVYADPNASDEDKAAALEKLTAFFTSLLDQEAQEATAADPAADVEAASETPSADPPEMASETSEPSKEMASALAQIQDLTARIAKMEKASSVGSAPRATKSTVLPRVAPVAPKDHIVSIIEAAERNTLRNLSK